MPSDDLPVDALKRQLAMEDFSISPIARKLVQLANNLPLVWPFSKAVESICDAVIASKAERLQLLLEACIEQLHRQDDAIARLRNEFATQDAEAYFEQLKDLLLDGARKAEATRAKERVKRIGVILAKGLVESANPDADEIEEMMRVAAELSDTDVDYLRELVRVEGPALKQNGRLSRYGGFLEWDNCFWGTSIDPKLDSVFSKLESNGLVSRVPPSSNLNITADFQNKYVLLPKGLRFAELARETAA